MKKFNKKKKLLKSSIIHSALLTSILICTPTDTVASTDSTRVSPVDPLNPAVDVHPTSAPPDSFSRPEKEQKSKEESYTDSTYTDSTEQIEKETDTKVTHKKKKKPSKLKNIHKLSAYPISNEGIVLESQSNTGSGSSNFTDNSTQVGQTLFKVSGILLYGKKCKI